MPRNAGLSVLHAVRITGFADTPVIADRSKVDPTLTAELLGDAEARGWVQHSSFADLAGWSLTERGRAEGERLLADELAALGVADAVRAAYRVFRPLNARLLSACTNWQLRPGRDRRLVENDHTDTDWDAGVVGELAIIDEALGPLVGQLENALDRFGGYRARFHTALENAQAGDGRWVVDSDRDSCHRVWFELHEDFVATLGINRGTEIDGNGEPRFP